MRISCWPACAADLRILHGDQWPLAPCKLSVVVRTLPGLVACRGSRRTAARPRAAGRGPARAASPACRARSSTAAGPASSAPWSRSSCCWAWVRPRAIAAGMCDCGRGLCKHRRWRAHSPSIGARWRHDSSCCCTGRRTRPMQGVPRRAQACCFTLASRAAGWRGCWRPRRSSWRWPAGAGAAPARARPRGGAASAAARVAPTATTASATPTRSPRAPPPPRPSVRATVFVSEALSLDSSCLPMRGCACAIGAARACNRRFRAAIAAISCSQPSCAHAARAILPRGGACRVRCGGARRVGLLRPHVGVQGEYCCAAKARVCRD